MEPGAELNPFDKWRIADFGDLSINPLSIEDTYQRITQQLTGVLKTGARSVCVGGDHSILLPILRAIHEQFGPVGFIQLDAHGDTWGTSAALTPMAPGEVRSRGRTDRQRFGVANWTSRPGLFRE